MSWDSPSLVVFPVLIDGRPKPLSPSRVFVFRANDANETILQ